MRWNGRESDGSGKPGQRQGGGEGAARDDHGLLPDRTKTTAAGLIDQPFSSGSIFFWNSSNEVSPLIFSPLTKKVGVESTFQHLGGVNLVGGDLVEQRLVLQAILDLLLGKPGLLADPGQRFRGVLHHPVVLLGLNSMSG